MKFTELNLAEELQSGLRDINFAETTAIQEKAIPPVLEGRDIIGVAQTGTGKTGAFVIPIVDKILRGKRDGTKALILTPTRELAQQIDEQIFAIGYHTGITSAIVIGGSDFSGQAKALKAGVDIIVATPGRLIDQKKVINLDFSQVEYLVLDEADRMLDMGFLPDMTKIINWMPRERQTLLFSATMPKEIERLASSIMNNPETVQVEASKPAQSVEQRAYFLKSGQKIPLVKQIFKTIEWESCIIFTSTKKGTDELQRLLKKEGIKAASIHGDRSQDERNKALAAFKNGQVPVIVATNVIARGIDIKDVSLIVNYDVPRSADDYIHRVGRTGRYDQSGIAVTFVTKRDNRAFGDISRIKENKITKVHLPSSFSEGDTLEWNQPDDKQGGRPAERSGSGKSKKKSAEERKTARKSSSAKGKRSERDSAEAGTQSANGRKSDTEKRVDADKKGRSTSKSRSESSERSPEEKTPAEKTGKPAETKTSSKTKTAEKKESKDQGKESGRPEKKTEAKSEKSRNRDNQKHADKARENGANQRVTEEVETRSDRPAVTLQKVEKAVERNRYARRPSKGVWGIIKSMVPKFKANR